MYSVSGIFHKNMGLGRTCASLGAASDKDITSRKGATRALNNNPNSTLKQPRRANSNRTDAVGKPIENLILTRIPGTEFDLIRPRLEFIKTRSYQSLHEPGEKLDYTFFPNSGMISVVIELDDGKTLEIGVVTNKGFAGESLIADQQTCPYRMICQPAVEGFRIKVQALREILNSAPHLRVRLNRYVHFQSIRTAQIAACNRFHEIEQRLARWLLMSQDRVGSAILPFTHDFLASMLGTGRANVTVAARSLHNAGAIEYKRGAVKVVNRRKLEGAVCECYATIKRFEAASERETS
jgi:CRP-like cAMP-binding protein